MRSLAAHSLLEVYPRGTGGEGVFSGYLALGPGDIGYRLDFGWMLQLALATLDQ